MGIGVYSTTVDEVKSIASEEQKTLVTQSATPPPTERTPLIYSSSELHRIMLEVEEDLADARRSSWYLFTK